MRILITGPGGFLGSALAKHWAASGHELWLLARPTSSLDRLPILPASVRLERVATFDEIVAVLRESKPDAIVHTANSYGRNGEALLDVLDANVRFGMVLMQTVLFDKEFGSKCRPTIFLNTGTVLPSNLSPYALSKAQFSAWGALLSQQMPAKLQFINIRLQHMYGPGDDDSKFTSHVINTCFENRPYLALTEGHQRRDLIYIDDVVSAYDLILNKSSKFRPSDEIEVGTGIAIEVRTYVEEVKRLCQSSTKLGFGSLPYRMNEPMECKANIERLKSLGWRQKVEMAAGIAASIEMIKSTGIRSK
jgi:CDP-paratose synthetase